MHANNGKEEEEGRLLLPATATATTSLFPDLVLVVSCCSGHGFKFSPVIGEIAADMIEGYYTRGNQKDGKRKIFDIDLFSFQSHLGGHAPRIAGP